MFDVSLDYLVENLKDLGMSEDKIYFLLERLQGFRVYINKKEVLKYKIKKRYYQLKGHLPNNEIVKRLSNEFELSQSRIRQWIAKIQKEIKTLLKSFHFEVSKSFH